MRKIFIVALIILVGGGIWIVVNQWSDAPTEEPAVRERIAGSTTSDSTNQAPAQPTREAATPSEQAASPSREAAATVTPRSDSAAQSAVPPATQEAARAPDQEGSTPLGAPTPPAEPLVVTTELQSAINEALATLGAIGDDAAAEQALIALRKIETRIEGITVDAAALPEGGREAAIAVAAQALPDLRSRADALRGQGGPADKVMAPLDELIADLEAFTKGPT